jgi:hypothetical protein
VFLAGEQQCAETEAGAAATAVRAALADSAPDVVRSFRSILTHCVPNMR